MTVDQAFAQALEYETRIRDQYLEAATAAIVPEARVFYETLARDEASHAAYIAHKLDQWKASGTMSYEGLASELPEAGRLAAAMARAASSFTAIPEGGQYAALSNALRAERETSAFYRSLVGELPGAAADVFARLLEIEDGHTAIVQAELDLVTGTGHWFDLRVFDMEE